MLAGWRLVDWPPCLVNGRAGDLVRRTRTPVLLGPARLGRLPLRMGLLRPVRLLALSLNVRIGSLRPGRPGGLMILRPAA